jgi:lysozyme
MSLNSNLVELIKEDLIRHEGCVLEIYLDSEHLPTFGIGHLVIESDIESSWPVGTPVTKDRVDEVFEADFNTAYSDACAVFLNLESNPDNVIRVCVNMAFNLGRNRLSKFKRMIEAVNAGFYNQAADEMVDSKWYGQTGRRSKELVELMRGS